MWRGRDLLLFLLCAVFAVPKWWLTSHDAHHLIYSIDGSYYVDVAMNVRDGLGLVTDVSPFHQGLPYFPHPSTIYPAWPLLLGYASRLVPIEHLAFFLPAAFYFLALFLAARVGRAYFPGELFRLGSVTFDAGHLLALLLAQHQAFFVATSRPYTEGLAYCVLCLTLLWCRRLFSAPGLRHGFGAGALGSLCFLCRSQLAVVPLAIIAGLLLAVPQLGARRAGEAITGALLGIVLGFFPEYLHLASFVHGSTLASYVFFDQFRATAVLSPFAPMFPVTSLEHFVRDRSAGVLRAFDPYDRHSYVRRFGALTYALLLAPPLGLKRLVLVNRRASGTVRDRLLLFWRGLSPAQVYFFALALGSVVSLHLVHTRFWGGWLFTKRHGLLAVWAIFLATWMLLQSRSRLLRALVAVMLLASTAGNYATLVGISLKKTRGGARGLERSTELVAWINHAAEDSPRRLVLAARHVKQLAPGTPNAAYHELRGFETLDELVALFDVLGTDYLIADRRWPLTARRDDPLDFASRFAPVASTRDQEIFDLVEGR